MMTIMPVRTTEPATHIRTQTQGITTIPTDVAIVKIAIDAMSTFPIELAEAPQETAMTEKYNTLLGLPKKDTDCLPLMIL